MSLIILASFFMVGNVEVFAEDCDEGCKDDCASACDCVNCPPSLIYIDIKYWNHADLPTVFPPLAPDESLNMEQKWFNSIDHPPQDSL
jgi:hypothetical protein